MPNEFMLLLGGLILFGGILWIAALIDLIKTSKETRKPLSFWLPILLFFPILGPILYFMVGRRNTAGQKRSFKPVFNH